MPPVALIKMEPAQANRIWPDIAPGIAVAVPPTAGESVQMMTSVLARILDGDLVLWMICRTYDVNLDPLGHLTTVVVQDHITGQRNLLIYSLYVWELLPDEIVKEGIEVLRRYAKGMNCAKVIAFTKEPRVEEMIRMAGGNSQVKFLEVAV